MRIRAYLIINIKKLKVMAKEVMLHKQNPLTGDWLCYIPDTSQAYYCPTEKKAKDFCDKINKAFAKGELKIIEGRVIKVKK